MSRTSRSRLLATLGAAGLLALTACGGGAATSGSPATPTGSPSDQALPPAVPAAQVLAAVAAAPNITKLPSDLTPSLTSMADDTGPAEQQHCQAHQSETSVQDCVYGDQNAKRTIVLYGDSHAGMWQPGLDLAGLRAHWRVVLLAKPGCPAPILAFWDVADRRPNTECTTWHGWAVSKINSLNPAMVVITSASFDASDATNQTITPRRWQEGLTALVTAVSASGRRVLLLGDMPYLNQVDADCLAAHESNVQACSTPPSEAITPLNAAEQATATATGATYINTEPWLCSTTCTGVIGNIGVFFNRFHITKTYSDYLSGVLGDSMKLNAP